MARERAGEQGEMAWSAVRPEERHPYPTYWLVTRADDGAPALLAGGAGEETLPVFGFREEAEMFLEIEGLRGGDRRLRGTDGAELLSILSDPCGVPAWISLDPLPGFFARPGFSRMERERFVAFLREAVHGPPGPGPSGRGGPCRNEVPGEEI